MINYVCFYELWMNYNYCNTVLFYLKLDGIYEERIYNNIDKKKIVRFNPQSFFLGNLKIVENACNTAASNALLASDFLAQPAGRDTRKLGFSIPHTRAFRVDYLFHVENVSNLLSTFASCQTADSRFVYCVPSNRDRSNPKPTAALAAENHRRGNERIINVEKIHA